MHYIKTLYKKFIFPKSRDSELARKELIFNVIITSFWILTIIALTSSTMRYFTGKATENNVSPLVVLTILIAVTILAYSARKNFRMVHAYIFIIFVAVIGTYTLAMYGYIMSMGLLINVLLIVLSGILISARVALVATAYAISSIIILYLLQINNAIKPRIAEINDPLRNQDVVVISSIFIIIYTVSWLSSREINRSLNKAKEVELLLRIERDSLDEKVKTRTKEIERIQAESTIELYRFAEFGKLSSSLLHDLSSPLMAVAINFGEYVDGHHKNELVDQIKEGISSMESYVLSARKQLYNDKNVSYFFVDKEVIRTKLFIHPIAKSKEVSINLNLIKNVEIRGSSVRFNQMLGNLIKNAVDAFESSASKDKHINIKMHRSKKYKNNVCISVLDNGPGIPVNIRDKIFKPFYTTKSKNKGTGIGLSIVTQIVNEFDGKLVMSTNSSGTIFKVYLPIHRSS